MNMRLVLSSLLVTAALFAQDQPPHVAFMSQFEQAVKADQYAKMKDLVARNQPHVLAGFFFFEHEYCSAVSNGSEDDKTHRMNVLEKLATIAAQDLKDKTVQSRIAWLKGLDVEQCTKKLDFNRVEYDGENAFNKGQQTTDKADYQAAAAHFDKAFVMAVELGDIYWQVNLSLWLGNCYQQMEDRFGQAYHLKRAIEISRDANDQALIFQVNAPGVLKDIAAKNQIRDDLIDVKLPLAESRPNYEEAVKAKLAEAAKAGPGGDAGASAGGKKLPADLPPMPNRHMTRIEWVAAEKPKYKASPTRSVLTANVKANGNWMLWYDTTLPPGAPMSLDRVPGDNKLHYEKGKVTFDPDAGGKAGGDRLKIAMGKPELVQFKARPVGEAKVDVAHVVMEQPKTFAVNAISLNFKAPGPQDPMYLKWKGAGSVTTKYEGCDVTIYDDSANGLFDTYGEDSIVITSKGKPTRSSLLSRIVYVGDMLFELKVDPSGQNIEFKPFDGPVGLLEFKYGASTMPAFMNIEGTGQVQQCYFNLMECKDKPMWVPAGEYRFFSGYFAYGDGDKRETISVTNPGDMRMFKVAETDYVVYEMGAAKEPGFTFRWKASLEKDKGKTKIILKGEDIRVFGCAGEEYGQFMAGIIKPTVKARAKSGATFYDKQMKAPAREDVDEKPWTRVVFFPKDIDIDKDIAGEATLELEADFPRLGKITSKPTVVE